MTSTQMLLADIATYVIPLLIGSMLLSLRKKPKPKPDTGMDTVLEILMQQRGQKEKRVVETFSFELFPHTLFWGQPGLGKTTFVQVIANELRKVYPKKIKLISLVPNALKTHHQLSRLIEQIEYGDVLFIDEIHGLDLHMGEALYSALQDFVFHYADSDGFHQKEVPKFTFMSATTLAGMIDRPLRERHVLEIELEPASEKDLSKMLESLGGRAPETLDEYIGQDQAKELIRMHINALGKPGPKENQLAFDFIAERSMGTPRIAKQLFKHVLAYAKSQGRFTCDLVDIEHVFKVLNIDHHGLNKSERRIIQFFLDRANRPAGVGALANAARVTKKDLEEMIEPKMARLDFIDRSTRGRFLTDNCLRHYKTLT